jgi:hypothetical protein
MKRSYYSDSIATFLKSSSEEILGKLALNSDFSLEQTQRHAWLQQIAILQKILSPIKVLSTSSTPSHEWGDVSMWCC